LPEDANAGNQFYGGDVAEFIRAGLERLGQKASAIDEDWGWLVSWVVGPTSHLDIAIYNLNAHSEGGRPGEPEWGLWLRSYERGKRLGFLPMKKEVPTPKDQLQVIEAIFREHGIYLEPWEDSVETSQ
jgi:hypothetical protein